MNFERRILQSIVALLAAVPVLAGLGGIFKGPAFLGVSAPWPADLDSHLRFLSGVLLIVGLAWYSCVPTIEAQTARFRLLGVMTVCGGLARLCSLGLAGSPSIGHLYGLLAELVLVPALVLWQARIARMAGQPAGTAGKPGTESLY